MNNTVLNLENDPRLLEKLAADRSVRRKLGFDSHFWFFHLYFGHYIKYPTADFQREMFALTQDPNVQAMVIVAFRGSAKSTIMNLSLPIWSILGIQQKKFILILGQTQEQARQHLRNIKEELERNELLRNDLGPFREEEDEWRSYSLVLPNFGAKIMAASTETAVRGLRHGAYRPDLIIGDDLEDQSTVKTKEVRDKTYNWLTGEVIPAGDQNTRLVIIGNLLHEDSLLMRLQKAINQNGFKGVFKMYPLVDGENNILWPGKFKNLVAIEAERQRIGNESSWYREYLLKIISNADRVIHPDWVQYYDVLPPDRDGETGVQFSYAATGVDLAISQKETADYTAMVSVKVFSTRTDGHKIYILPNPVNQRLTFPQTLEKAKLVSKSVGNGNYTRLLIEQVGYQESLVQQLQREGVTAEGIKVGGSDKRERLALTTAAIQSGKIVFPRVGAEDLIAQLTGFGIEKHDDLADAFSIVAHYALSKDRRGPGIRWLNGPTPPWARPITAGLYDMQF